MICLYLFIEEKVETLAKQNRILENEKHMLISNQERLSIVNQNLEAEKRDLLVLLDKRVKENDRLNGKQLVFFFFKMKNEERIYIINDDWLALK